MVCLPKRIAKDAKVSATGDTTVPSDAVVSSVSVIIEVSPDQLDLKPSDASICSVNSSPADEKSEAFIKQKEADLRNGYIRKIYGILFLQMLFTSGIGYLFMYISLRRCHLRRFLGPLKKAFLSSVVFVYAFTILPCLISIVTKCCKRCFRRFPYNYIILFIFTLSITMTEAVTASYFRADQVVMAFSSALAIFFVLSGFAFLNGFSNSFLTRSQLPYDTTKWYVYIVMVVMAFFSALVLFYVFHQPLLTVGITIISTLVFCCYLIRLMIGLKANTENPDDYIFAVMKIYMNIITLFHYLFKLMTGWKKC